MAPSLEMLMKKILGVHSAPPMHWVGNGFPVRSLFSYDSPGAALSPFLLLDHASPTPFGPGIQKRGVGVHPHRGFETVTLVYQGEVDHKDSTGAGGQIGPGDVQWMTAGSGILHEEFHSDRFTRQGGDFEVVQLWVNLPAKHKMTAPGYQTLQKDDFPVVDLPDEAGQVSVVSGAFQGASGPARTFTPIHLWNATLNADKRTTFDFEPGYTALFVVLEGVVMVNGQTVARTGQWVHLDRADARITVEANTRSRLLLMSGEPIDEPVVGYGPFVMNTQKEIEKAFQDLHAGKFGDL
jgi:redox-sensitive bicupin YhaK (pirin superfamily)